MGNTLSFQERCLQFSADIFSLISLLPSTPQGKHVADQLLRSGTSVGANVHEARGAESRADFIHKMQIALKEAREAHFWLSLIEKVHLIENTSVVPKIRECNELASILAKSVMTARKNGQMKR